MRLVAVVTIAVAVGVALLATRLVHGTHVLSAVRSLTGLGDETGRLVDVERRFPGWRVTGFHHPSIAATDAALTISGGEQPAGAFFRAPLDPGSVYRLIIDGAAHGRPATVRLRFDGGADAWRTLGTGRVTLILKQAHTVEALVYADGPYSYRLESMKLERCADCVTSARAAQVFPGWDVIPYVSTPIAVPYEAALQVLRPAQDGIALQGRGGATGVLLTRRLDPNVTYRLRLHGTRANAAPALRIRIDDRPFIWRTLDRGDGDLNLVLPKGARIEALLYSDDRYEFEVHSLALEPCSDCITDEMLAARIRREAGVAADDRPLTVAGKVRDWVARTVVFGQEPKTVAITTNALLSEPAWQSYVDFFVPRRGGVWCAGIARYYQQVLALFGLPSVTLDIGYEGTDLTHVTDAIVIAQGDTRRFYIIDPTFAAAYADDRGRPVDLVGLLDGRPARFEMEPMSRTILMAAAAVPAYVADASAHGSAAACGESASLAGVAECRVEDHNRYDMTVVRRSMAAKGLRASGDYILTLLRHRVIALHGSDLDDGAAADLRANLVRRGITVVAVN
jgi:hypothetical protein